MPEKNIRIFCGDFQEAIIKVEFEMIKESIKIVIRKINALLGIDLFKYTKWIENRLLGWKRINVEAAQNENGQPIKLHLGCGDRYIKGYINVDHRKTTATDLVCDIKKLPFNDGTVNLIEIYHVIEHLPRNDVQESLKEWYRLLEQGGKLIIEYPDFDQAVKEYLAGNERRIDNIFGLQRFPGDAHLFGYNAKRMRELLQNCGFKEIIDCQPQDYHRQEEPCLRIEASK